MSKRVFLTTIFIYIKGDYKVKKKLLVLSASAILASNFIFDNSASAVVDVRENPYTSTAKDLNGHRSHKDQVKVYIESLEDLIQYLSLNVHSGYDDLEYKEAYDEYQKRFMAEMDALNQFRKEQSEINEQQAYWYPEKVSNKTLGLTYERYERVFENLLQNRKDFAAKARDIQEKNNDLRKFDKEEKYQAGWEINQLENKIIMIGNTFIGKPEAVENMYNKLDIVVGISKDDRSYNSPRNKRALERMKEDLETIIDQFFEEANLARPKEIPAMSAESDKNKVMIKELRKAAYAAKEDERLVDPNVKIRADKAKKAEEAIKAERKAKKVNAKNLKSSNPLKEKKKQQTFKHKVLKQSRETKNISKNANLNNQPNHGNIVNSISGNSHNKKPASIGGESKPVNIIQDSKAPSQYGSNGHLIEFSENTLSNSTGSVKQQPTFTEDTKSTKKEVITESHAVDLDEKTTHYMSGYTTGYSVEDTSGFTERDKRAIRRNHVREAEELVNKYVNSHAYQDRVAAQAKVKTLSPEQQKRLNQQIDKIYNGQ
ncbi:coagulase [Staphylococcus hyicus]|nr:coagulase [Staphylococcus hyicus]NJI30431.1 coagulase [Staphylococcus hyicus]